MKLLAFSHDSSLYGAQRSLMTLLRGLRERSHAVLLVLPNGGPLIEYAAAHGVPTAFVPYPYPSTRPLRALGFFCRYPSAAADLRRRASDEGPDVILYNTSACLAPAAALRRSGTPRLWHIRERPPAAALLETLIERWSDSAVFNSLHTAGHFPRLQERPSSAVVYNGIDVVRPTAERIHALRASFGWSERDVALVFAGQLRAHKNPRAVVRAASEARRRSLPVKCCLVGDGPLRQALARDVQGSGLGGHVALTGFRDDSEDIIAAADIVVCPSLIEPFGRTAVEAMALCKPVVAAETGGLPEIVVHNKTGLLVAVGDDAAFTEAVCELASAPERRERIGAAGRKRYEEMFTAEAYVDSMEAILESLACTGRQIR